MPLPMSPMPITPTLRIFDAIESPSFLIADLMHSIAFNARPVIVYNSKLPRANFPCYVCVHGRRDGEHDRHLGGRAHPIWQIWWRIERSYSHRLGCDRGASGD